MLEFTYRNPARPARRDAVQRAQDFAEIDGAMPQKAGAEQAARCAQCGIPFCQSACPVANNIPDWLRLSAEGHMRAAYELSAATNSMPEICGRICPQDRLCEGDCVIEQSGHGAVTIGAVEKFITETAWENGWVEDIKPEMEHDGSVGVIGAGPGGMTIAEKCREQGWQVTIYDRYDRAGGLLVYGIPNFKLDKKIVQRRVDRLKRSGVKFEMNTQIGSDLSLAELRAQHDAIVIATGVYQARSLDIPGADARGVVKALPFLTLATRRLLGDEIAPGDFISAEGKNIVVIGGGDTAMDCVRTSIRQGARSVTCLYRRDEANMPGSVREREYAQAEGVKFEYLAAPRAIKVRASKAVSVIAQRMQLGKPDQSGRARPELIPNSDFELPADLVIEALGFEPENLPNLFGEPDLPVTQYGTIRLSQPTKFATNMEGVYAIGDIVNGASLVVWAVHDGIKAASAIHHYICEKQLQHAALSAA